MMSGSGYDGAFIERSEITSAMSLGSELRKQRIAAFIPRSDGIKVPFSFVSFFAKEKKGTAMLC